MPYTRIPRWILIPFLLAALLAGCSAGQAHTVIHADGSADVELTLRLPSAMAQSESAALLLEDALTRAGFAVRDSQTGNTRLLTAVRRFDRGAWQSGGSNPQWRAYADAAGVRYSADGSWFFTDYRLQATIDPLKLLPDSALNILNKLTGSLPRGAGRLLANRIYVNLLLTLPVPPRASNADRVSDGGRTLAWQVALTEPTEVRLEVRAPNVRHMIYAGAGGLTLVLPILWLLYKRAASRRSARRHGNS